MARIAGVELPREKRLEVALTYVFGIGLTSSKEILEKTGIDPNTRVHQMSDEHVAKLDDIIEKKEVDLQTV